MTELGNQEEEEEIVITFVEEDEPVEYIKIEDYTNFKNITIVDNKNVLIENNSNIELEPFQIMGSSFEEDEDETLEDRQLAETSRSKLFTKKSVAKNRKKFTEVINRKKSEWTLCAVCGKLVRARNMSKHGDSHGDQNCTHCSLSFKTTEELDKHKEVHFDNEYPCQECELSFKTATEFAFHNFKHKQVYPCPLCNFVTKAKSSIAGHIKRHQGKLEYCCTICGKGFIGKALLVTHEEIHLDIKRYACDLCGKKFSVRRYLDVHRQLNHKKELYGIEELFQCEICGREFTFEKSLRRHRSVIHQIGEDRTVECKVCHKTIANNYNLKLHMRIHTGEKNYCCDLCGKAFSAYKYWKKHKLMHERKESSNSGSKEDVSDVKIEDMDDDIDVGSAMIFELEKF